MLVLLLRRYLRVSEPTRTAPWITGVWLCEAVTQFLPAGPLQVARLTATAFGSYLL